MYNPPSKKTQLIRQVVIYLMMTVTVVSFVFILILLMLGYRFNRIDGKIEQGGLVQFDSAPPGANISLDSTRLSSVTPAKLTITAGQHVMTMSRDGYVPWRKSVSVVPGEVLWLNYARLIPTDLPVSSVANFPTITSSLASPNRKLLALTTDPAARSISLVDTNADSPKLTTLVLPEGSYTVPAAADGESLQLMSWDGSNRYILVKHEFDDKSEWIVADMQNIESSKNISSLFDVSIAGMKFSNASSKILYALIDGDVRKIDIDGATISAPLVKNVAEFSLYDRSMIVYVSLPDAATKQRTVGYYEDGAATPRTLRTYGDESADRLHVAFGKYYGDTHVAIAYGETIDILKGPLPRSDSVEASSLSAVATMTIPGGVDYLSSKTDGRFFIAQHGDSFSVYDLELDKLTSTKLQGSTPVSGELRWLDGYSLWSSRDGRLRLYDFDGANQHDIMPIAPGQNPTLSQNERYIYAPTKDDQGISHLSRVRLILK